MCVLKSRGEMKVTICSSSFRRYSPSSHHPTDTYPLSGGTSFFDPLTLQKQRNTPKTSPGASLPKGRRSCSSGVYGYYSDSDSEEGRDEDPQQVQQPQPIKECHSELNTKRTRLEDKEDSHLGGPQTSLPPTNFYFPSSLNEMIDLAITHSSSSDPKEAREFNSLDLKILDLR